MGRSETAKVVAFVALMAITNTLYLAVPTAAVQAGMILTVLNPFMLGFYLSLVLHRPGEEALASFLRVGASVSAIAVMALIYQWAELGLDKPATVATQWRRTILFAMHLLVVIGILLWWRNRAGYSPYFTAWIIAAATLQTLTYMEFGMQFGAPEPSIQDAMSSVVARQTGMTDWVAVIVIPCYLLIGEWARWTSRTE